MTQLAQLDSFEHCTSMRYCSFEVNVNAPIGFSIGLSVSLDKSDGLLRGVIYRLIEVDGLTDYQGPFMIDAEGVVRVSGELNGYMGESCSFIIEALALDSDSSQSDVQTIFITA